MTLANVLSALALFFALGGGAYAITVAKNSVGSQSIRDGAIKSVDVGDNKLRGHDIRNRSLRGRDVRKNSLTGAHIAEGSLNLQSPSGTPAARVTFDATQNRSIPNTTANFSTVSWNKEVFDIGGLHSGGNPEVLTAPESGVYVVSATVELDNQPAVDDNADVSFFMYLDESGDDGDTIASAQIVSTIGQDGGNFWWPIDLNASGIAMLDKGDSVQVDMYQVSNGGPSLALNPGDSLSSFQMVQLAPASGSAEGSSGPGPSGDSAPTATPVP